MNRKHWRKHKQVVNYFCLDFICYAITKNILRNGNAVLKLLLQIMYGETMPRG